MTSGLRIKFENSNHSTKSWTIISYFIFAKNLVIIMQSFLKIAVPNISIHLLLLTSPLQLLIKINSNFHTRIRRLSSSNAQNYTVVSTQPRDKRRYSSDQK